MHRGFIGLGALLGALAVAFGAFGAHGLEKLTDDAKILHGFTTGVTYQMYHALVLLVVGIVFGKFSPGWLNWSGIFFITGILLFSGSLYLLTFLKIENSSAVKFAGPVTPVGGLFLILGWVFLLAAAMKKVD